MDHIELKRQLDSNPELQYLLFDKGFLITDFEIVDLTDYPFYGNWKKEQVGCFYFLIHKRASYYIKSTEDFSLVLIGHAYNPFSSVYSEDEILNEISQKVADGSYQEVLDELTGVFFFAVVRNNKISFQLDASGMQYGCYGTVNGGQYISSHMQLIGDICGLEESAYVRSLVSYRWYHYMMGNYLPGNITCFEDIKRIIPNTEVSFEQGKYLIKRFYPNQCIKMADDPKEYDEVIEQASEILKKNMELIPKKWDRPAISLTGGIDSNTTFAAANGIYDKYRAFSYISMDREKADAEKAEKISSRFQVPYSRYQVPDSNDEFRNFEVIKSIFIHNDGEIGGAKDNDVRKKITLINNDVCDVEVKSWISETIRAYAYKYFGRTKFPVAPTPRIFTSLYKIFLGNRKLAQKTDSYFEQYFAETELISHLYNYDYTDFFVWEMMHGGKCGLNIGVMKSCFDITIPYNNRKLLDLLLRVPLEKRISDQHHLDLKKKMNRELFDMNIRVVNLNETNARKKAINAYYIINTHIPF